MARNSLVLLLACAALLLAGCSSGSSPSRDQPPARPGATKPQQEGLLTISLVGTSDLHGHLETLPILAGYLANLRSARAREDGGVLLIDAGDMFQGTLESNTAEGAPVIAAYNHLGYAAAAIGNHEYDFGPEGPENTASAGGDPRGALRARAAQANFPLLLGNMVDARTSKIPAWDNVLPSALVEVAGVKVGIVGVTTMATPRTTLPANVKGLAMRPLAASISGQASLLRGRGAELVVVAAHAGSVCEEHDQPDDLSSCDLAQEIFEVAQALAPGTVSAIVAGHTHRAIAHNVNGIAIVQSFAYGRAFGRVDLVFDRATRAVRSVQVHPPQYLCRSPKGPCETHAYEGAEVTPSAELSALLAPTFERVRALKEQTLGVHLSAPVKASYGQESSLGNLFTDLMLAARPGADLAVTNGGGLRADLPAGSLTYGHLYEAMPFDNRLAFVGLTGTQLASLIRRNLERSSGLLSISGMTVEARCQGDSLEVVLARKDGRAVGRAEKLTMLTNTYLASGGDGLFAALGILPASITKDGGKTMRDEMAAILLARGATSKRAIDPATLYDPTRPRLRYPGKRPVRCP